MIASEPNIWQAFMPKTDNFCVLFASNIDLHNSYSWGCHTFHTGICRDKHGKQTQLVLAFNLECILVVLRKQNRMPNGIRLSPNTESLRSNQHPISTFHLKPKLSMAVIWESVNLPYLLGFFFFFRCLFYFKNERGSAGQKQRN